MDCLESDLWYRCLLNVLQKTAWRIMVLIAIHQLVAVMSGRRT